MQQIFSVILSEQSESKDLRTSFSTAHGRPEDPSTPLRFAQDDKVCRKSLTRRKNWYMMTRME